ncbi:thioredoxin reductase (NADPH) [Saccharothrix tamanrassetensis]|uniref:Thioredoxin reductase (NADPH) n=1 Tax=Saccharothrix tamanrassetensis TaxID=1051531 RepID=A0A841CQL7_9PSEU|nr:FAD-dependent oxidoreductase [Saccharothrix tamanrassetensis]MBB5959510.1 thioredoxin reductase (NADPH) [Saccharothrix tamanrassetensis]
MADPGLRVVERDGSARDYAIKDFLARNQVPFETRTDPGLTSVAVELPDGSVLAEPSLIELATALGLTDEAGSSHYDLVVVGGGPSGLAAAVYAACEGLRVVIVEDDAPGGQAGSTSRIENYLGFPAGLSGGDLAQRALAQARRFGVQWMSARRATALRRDRRAWVVDNDDGSSVRGAAVLVATGMRWRELDVPGAAELRDAGVFYGASTPVAVRTAGDRVFVLGAGNSAGQAALYLAEHGRRVTLLVRGPSLAGSPMSRYLVDRIEASELVDVRPHAEVVSVGGTDRLSEIVLRDNDSDTVSTVPATSLYVLIGMTPCTDWLGGQATTDTRGFLVTGTDLLRIDGAWRLDRDPLLTETTLPGVFAAGDVRSGTVKRIGSAIGQGAVASQAIMEYLKDVAVQRIPEQARVSSFDLLDGDRDGVLGAADLTAFGRRLVAAFDESPDTERARRVHEACGEFWAVLSRFSDKDSPDGEGVGREAFVGALDELAALNAFAPLADAVLLLSDTDSDGSLTLGEFQRLLGALGAPTDAAATTFGELDHEHSGYLDTTRLAAAGVLLGRD